MKKIWIKFLKDYTDPDSQAFKKDQVIEIDEEIGKSLVSLKLAENTEEPKLEKSIEIAFEKATKTLEEALANLVNKSLEEVSKNIDKRVRSVVNVTREATPMEEYSKNFNNDVDFFMAVLQSSQKGHKLDERFTKAPTGMNTIDDMEGGFLVPDNILQGIMDLMISDEMSLLGRTDQRQTSSNNLKTVVMRETSRKATYRHAGMAAYWLAEADEFTASQPKFGKFSLDLHKLGALAYVTEEELADASVSVAPLLSKLAAKAIMFLVNQAIITGTGVGKPKGILREESLITVQKRAGQGNTTILHRNITQMWSHLHPNLRQGAVWLVHPNVEELLEFVQFDDTTTAGVYPIYFPAGTTALTQNSILGRMKGAPVIPCEFCSDLGNKGDIILANFGEYMTLTKAGGGIKSMTSAHVRFLYEEMAYRWSFRIGGGSPWTAPIEDLNGSKVRGPFVTLEDRTSTPVSSGL